MVFFKTKVSFIFMIPYGLFVVENNMYCFDLYVYSILVVEYTYWVSRSQHISVFKQVLHLIKTVYVRISLTKKLVKEYY